MFHHSSTKFFFKSHSNLHWSNPLRRWVHIKFAGAFITSIVAAPFISYTWTALLSTESTHPPDTFAGPSMQLMMEMAPLNLMSRTIGDFASSTLIPAWAHQKAISVIASLYSVDLNEFDPIETFETTQDFFHRRFRGGNEIVKQRSSGGKDDEEKVVKYFGRLEKKQEKGGGERNDFGLLSPCDAEILQCGEVDEGKRTMLQVKGFSYPVDGLFRMSLSQDQEQLKAAKKKENKNNNNNNEKQEVEKGEEDDDDELKRLFFLFHLRPGDYHRVHSPSDMKVHKTLYVPGLLYPTTYTATRWLPNLILSNERVLVFGERFFNFNKNDKNNQKEKEANTRTKKKGIVAMALVGATCVGKIHVSFDERILSNLADPPETSVLREYPGASAPVIESAEEVAHFDWGSCVVLVADVPKNLASSMRVKPGSEVKQGDVLV